MIRRHLIAEALFQGSRGSSLLATEPSGLEAASLSICLPMSFLSAVAGAFALAAAGLQTERAIAHVIAMIVVVWMPCAATLGFIAFGSERHAADRPVSLFQATALVTLALCSWIHVLPTWWSSLAFVAVAGSMLLAQARRQSVVNGHRVVIGAVASSLGAAALRLVLLGTAP